jgi:tetratricopeptide (TPR) repeat protein/tRNA A-37 threonylcarbamoyl transferase component Bud32
MSGQGTPMERRWLELAPLFDETFDLDETARAHFLAAIEDVELRDALRDLLAQASTKGALDDGSGRFAAALIEPEPGIEGRRIGAWRVGRAIGAGGMATVFAAMREDGAYVQQVAIKVLRQGLYDAYERERFVRERNILARLEHPQIARLLDGGLTDEGVPWFALEYVDGQPVTAYCDGKRLDLVARLRLFRAICATVDHAHRNLVVHRDLKPSNILVDRDGDLKLLDFGIARLLGPGAGDDATQTQARRMTPAYAAPEQSTGAPVTTATDVYALGVVLHELCTGSRPQWRDDGSLHAPSSAITGLAAATVAAARSAEPRALRRHVDGELDLIIAKSLRLDPVERYASAADLDEDLRRHAAGEPIRARADSRGYRTAKFIGRHRPAIAIATAFALAIIAGGAATWWQARAARAEALRADGVRDFVLAMFNGVTPDESKGRTVSARELVDRGAARLREVLASQPQLEGELSTELAAVYRQLGDYPRASSFAEAAVAGSSDAMRRARALIERGRTHGAQGDYADAVRDLREALVIAPATQRVDVQLRLADVLAEHGELKEAGLLAQAALANVGKGDGESRERVLWALGGIRFRDGDVAGAATTLQEALDLSRANHGETHTQVATIEHDLGVVLLQKGDAPAAVALLEQALATRRVLLGQEHPDIADSAFNLGTALRRTGQRERAATLINDAVAMQRKLLGPHHPAVATGLNSLAVLAYEQGDMDTAIARLSEALETARAAYGEHHTTVATMLNNLAAMQRAAGRYDDAEKSANAAIDTTVAAVGADHYLVGIARLGLGSILAEHGRGADALTQLQAAHALLVAKLGAEHQDTLLAQSAVASVLRQQGQLDAAQAQASAALAAAEKAFPPGHPRLGKVRLVAARVAASRGDCAWALSQMDTADKELAAAGPGGRLDRAWLGVERARCLHGGVAGTEAAGKARAALAALTFAPPDLVAAAKALRD